MTEISNERDIKVALTSLKLVLDTIQNGNSEVDDSQLTKETHGELELMLRKMRVAKLSQVFVQKLQRSNIFNEPSILHIKSQKQINENRIFQCKGVAVDAQFISFIYILDILFCLVTFVTASFRAFIEAFKTSGDSSSGIIIGLMITAIVVTSLKIIINSITITISDGILLEYLTDILINYMKSRLIFIDLGYVAINIAQLAVNNESQPLSITLFVISLVKLFSLYENLRMFQTTFINSFKKQQYFNLVKVALFNIFFAHFVCSMLLAMSTIDEVDNWRVVKGINQQPWFVQYIWAFYWACTIIMTVGFGDISAYFFKQAIIVAFIQLFSCIVLAFNISQIGSIIINIRSSQTEFRRKIAIFKRMATQNQINQQLQRRIEAYLQQQTQIKETFEFNQQMQLLDQIPQNLRNQYVVQANKLLFPDLPFFKNLQKNTLIKFTDKFTGKVYYPGQFLMKLQQGNDSIMILKGGKVGLAYKKYGSYLNGTIVQQIQIINKQVHTSDGDFQTKKIPVLLNADFLSQNKKINYDIVAREYSFVYEITYEHFFQVIKNSQIDSSYFFSIRHKHTVIQDQWEQLVCEFCSRPNQQSDSDEEALSQHQKARQSKRITKNDNIKYHTMFICPKLHYFPLNGVTVLKCIRNQGIQQKRDTDYFRRKKKHATSLLIRKPFFKHYQAARNFASKKVINQEKRRFIFKAQQVKAPIQPDYSNKKQQQKLEQIQIIQRVIREAIEEGLTGYKPQYWDLEIDKMHNFTNYFPLQNPKNLDFVDIKKGHSKALSGNKVFIKSNRKIAALKLMKSIQRENV